VPKNVESEEAGGVRPSLDAGRLHFGTHTPTESVPRRQTAVGQGVIAPEIAALVRQQLIGVVENGTPWRAHGGIAMPDGRIIPVGGQTGALDNRLESFSANGKVIGDKVVSRTATFVFMIGDGFYGTVVAFVPGSKAASALDKYFDICDELWQQFDTSWTASIQN
jgi:hypothetical protein